MSPAKPLLTILAAGAVLVAGLPWGRPAVVFGQGADPAAGQPCTTIDGGSGIWEFDEAQNEYVCQPHTWPEAAPASETAAPPPSQASPNTFGFTGSSGPSSTDSSPQFQPAAVSESSNRPVRITIPGKVDVRLVPSAYNQDGTWTVARDAGSYLANSAEPGKSGKVIVYGHNLPDLFGNLTALAGSEPIVITLADGDRRTYRITDRQEVPPSRTDLLAPSDREVLVLYTCAGEADRNRFVVTAVPAS